MARILLLETDCLLAKNFSKFLARVGHKVYWNVDPQAAIDQTDATMPDIIVLDIMLAGGRSGIEFLYELRSYPEWQSLPVIIFSQVAAQDLNSCLEAMSQLNIFAYRYKPTTTLSDLATTIDQAIRQPART